MRTGEENRGGKEKGSGKVAQKEGKEEEEEEEEES